jgi:dipeptidyl-peptidase-3
MASTTTFDSSQYLADKDAPIARLSATKFFNQLTEKEKLYAHYFSKAGHWGSRAVLRSVSPESEEIFDLILLIHKSINGNYKSLKVDESIVNYYLDYSSQILANLGNYKSFGDSKFIPRITIDEFQSLINSINDNEISKKFDNLKESIYSLDDKISMLGSPEDGHVSGYYLNKVSKIEGEAVDTALANNGIMPENIRVSKVDDKNFIVHVASSFVSNSTGYYPEKIDFQISDGRTASLTFKFGDHSKEFSKIVENLQLAKKYAANENQVKMLENYIASFMTGSMNCHYQSQIHWVKDLKPTVETNIGFIETYRDYLGTKGEWECLVAMVDKERTAKFGELVNNAKEFIADLPWDKLYEKDVFTPPDFTSLEVLTFAGSGCPAGINIPNYDKIRINIGFKNVSLGNVLSAKSSKEPISFISEDLQELYEKYRVEAFEVQVGIHELLGHGTGKLMMELDDGSFNFDKASPPLGLDGKPIKTYYKKGETWGSKFGSVAGSYEECRAESVAMFLGTNRKLLEIFGYKTKKEQDDIIFIMYVSMCRAGLLSMEYYDAKHCKWGQAHCQARYAILKNYLDAGNGLVKLEYTKEDFSDLTIQIDRSKIESIGQESIGEFLNKLHVYKCSGDVVAGTEFYNKQTTIPSELLKFRDIILKKKLPRKQLVQANTFVVENNNVICKEYEESTIGMIESFAEREC